MTTYRVQCFTCKGDIAFLDDDPTRPVCAGCSKSGDDCTCTVAQPEPSIIAGQALFQLLDGVRDAASSGVIRSLRSGIIAAETEAQYDAPLDVERLAKALKAVRRQQDHEAGRRKGYSNNYFDPEAEAIAAEYGGQVEDTGEHWTERWKRMQQVEIRLGGTECRSCGHPGGGRCWKEPVE